MESPYHSPGRDGDAEDAYQTPNDGAEGESGEETAKNDLSVVTEASRNLRNLLKDLLEELNTLTDATVSLSGELVVSIGDRKSYALGLTESGDDTPIDLRISPLDAPKPADAASSPDTRKRPIDLTADDVATPEAKRTKPNGERSASTSQQASALAAAARAADDLVADDSHPDPGLQTEPDDEFDLPREVRAISKQIRWVEDCRRTAATQYHAREERWRTTSATFHDQNRVKRERHEAWVAGEMARQTNMIAQLLSDVKGMYPLLHSSKWETPASMPHPLYPTGQQQQPQPQAQAAYQPPVPAGSPVAIARVPSNGHHYSSVQRGRPRGRPRSGGPLRI